MRNRAPDSHESRRHKSDKPAFPQSQHKNYRRDIQHPTLLSPWAPWNVLRYRFVGKGKLHLRSLHKKGGFHPYRTTQGTSDWIPWKLLPPPPLLPPRRHNQTPAHPSLKARHKNTTSSNTSLPPPYLNHKAIQSRKWDPSYICSRTSTGCREHDKACGQNNTDGDRKLLCTGQNNLRRRRERRQKKRGGAKHTSEVW